MSTNQPTVCKSVIHGIDDFLDGCGTAVEVQQIEDHLKTCNECRAYVDSYRRMLQLTRTALQIDSDDIRVPDGMIERTLKKLKNP